MSTGVVDPMRRSVEGLAVVDLVGVVEEEKDECTMTRVVEYCNKNRAFARVRAVSLR